MKKSILMFAVTLFSMSLVWAQEEVMINPDKCIVKWKGSQTFGFGSHHGTVDCKDGWFTTENGKITGGTFTMDMNTIKNTDGDYSENLVDHLKNEDFFEVENFPTAKLTMTNVNYLKVGTHIDIEADLMIKGITNPIYFRAAIDPENSANLTAKFIIDRTDWNIMYNSKSIINIKDRILSDAIEFEVLIAIN